MDCMGYPWVSVFVPCLNVSCETFDPFTYLCVRTRVEVRGYHEVVSSLLPTCVSWGQTAYHQAWPKAPLYAKSFQN